MQELLREEPRACLIFPRAPTSRKNNTPRSESTELKLNSDGRHLFLDLDKAVTFPMKLDKPITFPEPPKFFTKEVGISH